MEGLHAAVADALPAASGHYPPIPFAEGGPAIVPPDLGDDAGVLGCDRAGEVRSEGVLIFRSESVRPA